MKPIHKFNGGKGATLCHKCSVIISEGLTEDLYCEKCEQKQHLIDMMQDDEKLGLYDETLEEAAYEYAEPYRCPATNENEYCKHDIISAFNNGAKWQAERMYSEEDMIEFAKWVFLEVGSNTGKDRTNKELFNEWLNIKKK